MFTAWGAGGLTVAILALSGFSANSSSGQTLFHLLFVLGCYLGMQRGFRLTADLFSEERRNGTLGLLVLTGLKPIEIFANKLLGVLLVAAYGLLSGLPFLAVAFLIGGIQFIQLGGALIFVGVTLLFCLATGIFASVLHRDASKAQLTAFLIAGTLAIAPFVVGGAGLAFSLGPVPKDWLMFSPLFGAYEVISGFSGGPSLFLGNAAITLFYSVLAVLAGAMVLHRTWRDNVEVTRPSTGRRHWANRLAGGQAWRQSLLRELKAGNPLCWRAARNSVPVAAARGVALLGLAIWITAWVVVGRRWLSGGNFLLTSIVLHLGLNWALASAAARWLAEERQTGGFEMLFSTPVAPSQLVTAQRRALLLQFRDVLRLIFLLDAAMCVGGLLIRDWKPQALANHLAIWALMLLFWFGAHLKTVYRAMWIAAWTGRPAYAATQASFGLVWPFLFLSLLLWNPWLRNFPAGTLAELAVVGSSLFLMAFVAFHDAGKVREKLERELRDIACAPIPKPEDKRFKAWDPNKVFPPGRWGEFLLAPATDISRPRRFLAGHLRR
jgi:hypothetical protein